jgi:hypothetical protein
VSLLRELEERGVTLEPKLTFRSDVPLDPETLSTLKARKAELLRDLAAPDSVPRLPWQLERLLAAASGGGLPAGTVTLEAGLVTDLNSYTLAWGAAYLVGDQAEALRRLWQAHRAWQGVN